jgi:hypothetical protein
MEDTIRCLVDTTGYVYVMDTAESYAEVAARFGLDERVCEEYRFDLETRRVLVDRGTAAGLRMVRTYFDAHLGSPEKLMTFAITGSLPKESLTNLLASDRRASYRDACVAIQKTYTDQCAPTNGPCLESGCALEGEVCLQPLLRAGTAPRKAYAAEWVKLFSDARNRVDAWKN